MQGLWTRKHVQAKAKEILALKEVERRVAESDSILSVFLSKGEKGDQVKILQKILAAKKLLDGSSVTGLFGDKTEQALTAYQLRAEIIKNDSDRGAGIVGPATLAKLRQEQMKQLHALVRARGWAAL